MESDIIKISHLNKSFGEVKAVNDLSFRVKKGELFAFLGVNGAGKSTTISILCGFGRLCRHGACDSNALLLAAGHFARPVVHALFESHRAERVSGKPSALLPADAAVNERQLDVLDRCQRRNKIKSLKNEADLAVSNAGEYGRLHVTHRLPVQIIGPVGRDIQTAENVHQRAFARA